MIEIICLVVAGVLIEYVIFVSWRRVYRHLKDEGERNIFEFL